MKKIQLLLICISFQLVGFAQVVSDVDEIYPFQNDLAAIKKGTQWGFINTKGEMVINYRDDLVLSANKSEFNIENQQQVYYPAFYNERCIIKKLINDVCYYGYIDKTGTEVITPQFLNVTNFSNGYAIAIKLTKEVVGYNEVLKKDITTTKLEEYIIDTSGLLVQFLYNPRNYVEPIGTNKTPPKFESKFIAPHLVAVKNNTNKWDVYSF